MSFNLHRLVANQDAIKSIAGENLHSLLAGHEQVLADGGFVLPEDPDEPVDYSALTKLLMSPEKFPRDLQDAFFFINEMATEEGMESLLDAADKGGLVILSGQHQTPADVAVQVWLKDRDLLERIHAEQFMRNPRTFECFHTTAPAPVPAHRKLTPERMEAMAADMNDWFEKRKKGRSAKVFHYPRPDGIWFMVRHGDPFKREGAIDEKGESVGVYYWPERFDVLVLNSAAGKLRINSPNNGEKKKYREVFGRHLYGDADFFAGEDEYTLEPLREKGAACLAPIGGMEEVFLREVVFRWPGSFSEREIHRADDLFGAFAARGAQFPRDLAIIKAGFCVRFTDSETPRIVTIKPPNVAQYTRDGDGIIIERWAKLRGFIVGKGEREDEPAAEAVLARA
jgi:hypothetical protein